MGGSRYSDWVTAKISGPNRVIVSSPSVSAPETVRYVWGNLIPARTASKG